ncbi:MAG: ABC transporter permease, partial [Desulfobacteraceae bacterium]|nr:ABC transporter permease [Desulfobacteraceae bacterium]
MQKIGSIQKPFVVTGQNTIFLLQEIGRVTLFLASGFLHIFSRPFQFEKIIAQI